MSQAITNIHYKFQGDNLLLNATFQIFKAQSIVKGGSANISVETGGFVQTYVADHMKF